jgi:hypothetical protein
VRGARQRADDEQQTGLVDLDRQVQHELAKTVLAGCLGLDEAGWQRVGGGPLAVELDESKLGDVPRDRRLGRPEASFPECCGELLLCPDRPLVDEIPDRALAELFHHLHRRVIPASGATRRRRRRRG